MKFTIQLSEELLRASKGKLALGVIFTKVAVSKTTPKLDEQINSCVSSLSQSTGDIKALEAVVALNSTYQALGKSKSFKGSNESLLARIKEGKGIYRINTVVDINNLMSLTSARSIGSYDLSKLGSSISFRKGNAGESYKGTTKRSVDLANLPILSDENGPFGSPTSDSDRALISDSTTHLMSVIFSFDGIAHLHDQINKFGELLVEHCTAKEFQSCVLTRENPHAQIEFSAPQSELDSVLTPGVAAIHFSGSEHKMAQAEKPTKQPEASVKLEKSEQTVLLAAETNVPQASLTKKKTKAKPGLIK